MDPSKFTIVIPALNEEGSIGTVVSSLRQAFPQTELIVVDDGSTDRTGELAGACGARVISHVEQSGYGTALRTGTENAATEYVLFCDGDGQHSVQDVAAIMAAMDGYDMVVGERTGASHVPLTRQPGKFVLRAFANFLAGRKIPDLNSGLRAFRKSKLLHYMHLMPRGFSFSTTSTFAMLKTHALVRYVPITASARVGESSVRQWRDGPHTLMLMVRLTVLFQPLKVFLWIAAGLLLLSLVSVGIDLSHSKGGLADTTVILLLSTLITFMFGLVCDQVSAIRREMNR